MELNGSRHQIGIFRNDVAILTNPGDVADDFHFAEKLSEFSPLLRGQAQRLGNFHLVERSFGQECQNPRPKILFSAFTGRFFFAGHVYFSRKGWRRCKKMLALVNIRFQLSGAMFALKSPRGFTLIELLVVVAIIGVLMSLLFPAVQGVLDAAKKAQAKNDAVQIATAFIAFDTEYGRLPDTNSAPQQVTGDVLNALIASNTTLNPRRIIFLEVLNFKRGKGGISNSIFVDPWANPYYVALDGDYDNQVGVSTNGAASTNTTIMKKVGVWNNNTNSRQQVRSWD
jgi:prepilin-type N-terminal cleavage/methylation domain-containing protein